MLFRVAIVTCPASVSEPDQNRFRFEKYVRAARRKSARIICFPEYSLSGYDPLHITKMAQSNTGVFCASARKLSETYNITIIAGFIEIYRQKYFASQLIATPNKKIEIYRKIHLAPPEQKKLAAGRKTVIGDIDGVKFGVGLCYDAHFPLLATRLAQKGAQILFLPHASPNGTSMEKYRSWMRHLPARAFDNSMYVLATNQCGTNEAGLSFPAVMVAVGPNGRMIQKYTGATEKMRIVDLDMAEIARIRTHPMKYFLANHRADIG